MGKCIKKIGITFALMLLVLGTNKTVARANESVLKTGYIPFETKIIHEEFEMDADAVVVEPKNPANIYSFNDKLSLDSAEERAYWKQFSSHYYYDNVLNDAQKILWDYLVEGCLDLITTETDKTYFSYNISNLQITEDEISTLNMLFEYENPQFYFIQGGYVSTYDGYAMTSYYLYDEYKDGKVRKSETQRFRARIDAWIKDAKEKAEGLTGTEYYLELEKQLHDALCSFIVYDYPSLNGEPGSRGVGFDQSAVSGIVYGTTVCAGYTKALSILLNGVGIDTLGITTHGSDEEEYSGHAWNEVNIGGKWYMVDATWNDHESHIYRFYYNVSLTEGSNSDGRGFHSFENFDSIYKKVAPAFANESLTENLPNNYWFSLPKCKVTVNGNTANIVFEEDVDDDYFYLRTTVKYAKYTGKRDPKLVPDTILDAPITIDVSKDSYVNMNAGSSYLAAGDSEILVLGFYDINFDLNGVSGVKPDSITNFIGEKVTLPSPQITKEMHNFTGWNTEPDGTGYHFDAGEVTNSISFTPGDTVTLYAELTPYKYTINFDANGGRISYYGDKMPSMTCSYDKAYKLPKCEYTKNYNTFQGWKIKGDTSGKVYKDEETIQGLSLKDGDSITFEAIWKPLTYTIKFKAGDGASGTMEPIKGEVGVALDLPKCEFVKRGYTIYFWYIYINGERLYSASIEKPFTYYSDKDGDELTFEAIWGYDPDFNWDEKSPNKITATSSYKKTASTKTQTISLKATATGGKLKYKSSDSKVKVSSAGKVTIPKNYIGKVTITITAEDENFEKATKKVTITVNPAKVSLKTVTSPKSKQLKVSWNKGSNITGYEIQYTKDSKFKTGVKTATVSKASTASKTITKLTGGKTYYVRIRTYKTVGTKKYYSDWSASKSKKVKK